MQKGSLEITYSSGNTEVYGDGKGKSIKVRHKNEQVERGLILNPSLRFGELYMDGSLAIEQGTLYDYVALLKRNGFRRHLPAFSKFITALYYAGDRIKNLWRADAEKRMVAHHYDLDAKLYQMFLDEGLAIHLRLLRARGHDTGRGATCQEAPCHVQAAGQTR